MAQVTIKINGYAYTVGCEDGQETHLQAMSGEIEKRIERIKGLGGQSGEARLLVLAALLMADELHDLHRAPPPAPAAARAAPGGREEMRALADRAEHIAATLEHD